MTSTTARMARYLVTASDDKSAKVWDAQTGKELLSYSLPSSVYRAFFAPNGLGVVVAAG